MTAWLVVMVAAALVVVGVVVAVEVREHRRGAATWRRVELCFPRRVPADAVTAALGVMAALPHARRVVLDIEAGPAGIRHYLSTDAVTLDAIEAQLRALLPGARLSPARGASAAWSTGAQVRLSGQHPVVRSDAITQASGGLLSALQPLSEGERMLVRWTLAPSGRPLSPAETSRTGPQAPEWNAKAQGPLLVAAGVVAASVASRRRAMQLIGRVASALATRGTATGRPRLMPRNGAGLERALSRRLLLGGDRYSPGELAGLVGWPVEAGGLLGVRLGVSPVRRAASEIPSTGRVIGVSTFPGAERALAQPLTGALSHSLIAGPTGVGKSVLVTNLAAQDIAAGRGLLVLDGKGDTVRDLVRRIPRSRWGDVVLLDCASRGRLPGLRSFGGPEPELTADVVLGVLAQIFASSWGVLSERYLRAALVAVARDPEGTIADVPYVFADDAYRRGLLPAIQDPLTRSVLVGLDSMSAGERLNQLAAPLNKLGSLLGRPSVRAVLGQSEGALDFGRVLERGQIVLVSLSPARIGGEAARLIGALIVHQFFQATLERGAAAQRQPFMAYFDEPKVLSDVRLPLDGLLEQARALGVGVTLAPQSVAQLPRALREAVMTNAATRICFAQNVDDARLLARDLRGVDAEDLHDLGRFEAIARLALGPGEIAAPVSVRTSPLPPAVSDGRALRQRAAALGASTGEVDARLAERHTPMATGGPVGRIRRTS